MPYELIPILILLVVFFLVGIALLIDAVRRVIRYELRGRS
jgi:hypothetical protein